MLDVCKLCALVCPTILLMHLAPCVGVLSEVVQRKLRVKVYVCKI